MPPMDVYRVHLNSNKIIPLALGNMTAMVRRHRPDLLEMLNFNTPWLTERQILGDQAFLQRFEKPSIFLMSDYVWNLQAHTRLSRALKAVNPGHVIIHGGPAISYGTADFLQENAWVDFSVHGEGEVTCLELLTQWCTQRDYRKVPGLSFRENGQVVFGEKRERIADLALIPSPYLGGDLDALLPEFYCAVVETNRGCPYKCAYCSWGFYLRKVIKHDLDQVFAELEWIAAHHIPSLWIADANFGILERDIAITEHLCRLKERYGFPKNVITNFANNKRRSMEISRLLIGARIATSLGVAMQTTDETTLKNIRRKPVAEDYYLTLRDEYVRHQLPVMTHFIIGLPGSTYASFIKDIEFALTEKMYPQVFPAIVLPNTAMAEKEYRQRHGIVTEKFISRDYDEEWEVVVAAASFSREEYRRIHLYCAWLHFAVCYRTLKYLIYFAAVEQGRTQTQVLEDLLEKGVAETGKTGGAVRYPILRNIVMVLHAKAAEFFDQKICMVLRRNPRELYLAMDAGNEWAGFYQELAAIFKQDFGLPEDLLTTALCVQKSILPSRHHGVAEQLLDHDFRSYYFQEPRAGGRRSLRHFSGHMSFAVKDPKNICANVELVETGMRMLLNNFELDSPLWRNE